MKTLSLKISILMLFACLTSTSQEIKKNFKLADSILMSENLASKLFSKLDSLKSKFITSRSSLGTLFERDIDFGYKHQRIKIELNLNLYQIDILKKNDSIFVKTIRTYYDNYGIDTSNKFFNAKAASNFDYIKQRNKF